MTYKTEKSYFIRISFISLRVEIAKNRSKTRKIISKIISKMKDYIPPFTISERMMRLVSEISEKIGRIDEHVHLESKPQLRKNNRIQSIHSSLKIEANSLSLDDVRDVINGHIVIGDKKEIQEVKNAYSAYEKIPEINPFSIADLKRLHGIMTYRTVGSLVHSERVAKAFLLETDVFSSLLLRKWCMDW